MEILRIFFKITPQKNIQKTFPIKNIVYNFLFKDLPLLSYKSSSLPKFRLLVLKEYEIKLLKHLYKNKGLWENLYE